jgi:two-component system nitrogen regulation response regulator NtrX
VKPLKAKILIIDDEELIRSSLKKYLERDGYNVSTAQSGEEGLEVFMAESPDIVLLDLHLPGTGGLAVLESLKKIRKDIVVIIISAHGDIETAVSTIKMGAYDFIEKPFELKTLSSSINKALVSIKTCSKQDSH